LLNSAASFNSAGVYIHEDGEGLVGRDGE
jgi:hypothetical protein